jgi:hypothetical protein
MKYIIPVLLLGLWFSPVLVRAQDAQADGGIIQELSGTVEVKTPGADTWMPAKRGMRLAKAASISAGLKSTAVIGIGNSVLTVRPLTRLTLEEIIHNQGSEQVVVALHSGRVRTEVTPPSGGKTDFTVKSPSATASVRGTGFEFDTRTVTVSKGRVNLVGSDGVPAAVNAGESSYVDQNTGGAAKSSEVTAARMVPNLPAGTARAAAPSPAPLPVRSRPLKVHLRWYNPPKPNQ